MLREKRKYNIFKNIKLLKYNSLIIPVLEHYLHSLREELKDQKKKTFVFSEKKKTNFYSNFVNVQQINMLDVDDQMELSLLNTMIKR